MVKPQLDMLLKKNYFNKLLKNFKEGLQKILLNYDKPRYAIDMYWKSLQKCDNWFTLYPLTVTQYANYSNIENKHTDYGRLMLKKLN